MKKTQLLEQAGEQFSAKQVAQLERAIDAAAKAHSGQKRASGEPYITHPLTVASLLIEWGLDIDTVMAGVLHDTVEDTDLTLEQIEQEFDHDIAFLVNGVTKLGKVRSGMRSIDSYLPETKDNLTKFLIAIGEDVRVVIIKLADRLHNLQTLQHLPAEKQEKIARESLEVFASLADRLNMGQVRVQIEEISFSYLDPHRYKYLKKQMKHRLGRSSKKLDSVRERIAKELETTKVPHTMDGRIKSVYSLHKKLVKAEQNIDAIHDLIALRIIVENKELCYQVLGLIHSIYKPMPNRIKDYISSPKQNGYQSLHTTVLTPENHIVEFQIRTEQMHEYAEHGLAASFHYNEQKLTDAYAKGKIAKMPANLQWISDLQTIAARLSEGENVDVEQLKTNLFSGSVFIYSPQGDIFELPVGSSPLDFAYRIHSDIGKNAYGFKINDKLVGFDYELKTGDVVEVLTRRSIRPNLDWLKWLKTPKAKQKVRSALKKDNEAH
ncbi:MAG: RelA/SpoT family protein [Candidatus Nomurabacteria bacterium]|jgi:GTP pyrophosphokinase|nr:RelA/SpoT family protein [Candidatus Nomurabacteria bacterium]